MAHLYFDAVCLQFELPEKRSSNENFLHRNSGSQTDWAGEGREYVRKPEDMLPASILILKADRLLAGFLRQVVLSEFRNARCYLAHSRAQALDAFKATTIDLFLTDVERIEG